MFKYTLIYILLGSIFFGLIQIENYSPFFFLNDLQTNLTLILISYGVEFSNLPIKIQESLMLFDNGAKVTIDYTCNGLTAILLYTVAILSYPTYIKAKITWLIYGYIIIVAINLLRIFVFSYAVTINPDYFHFAHDYIGRYGMGLLTLGLFFIFTQYARISKKLTPTL